MIFWGNVAALLALALVLKIVWEDRTIYFCTLPATLKEYVEKNACFSYLSWPKRHKYYTVDREAKPRQEKYFSFVSIPNKKNRYNSMKFFAKYCDEQYFKREVAAHETLDPLKCPHIIQLHDAWPNMHPLLNKGMIITPRYNSFDFETLKNYPKEVIYQLLQAVSVLHDNSIIHRDITPQNIVWEWHGDKPHIYLTDFGISGYVPDEDHERNEGSFNVLGNRAYSPPAGCGVSENGFFPNDVWAIGVILTELLVDKPRMFTTMKYSEFCERKAELFAKADPAAVDLVNKLFDPNPRERVTAKEALIHPYFNEFKENVNEKKRKRKSLPRCNKKSKLGVK